MSIKVTIGIPTFNQSTYIEKAVQSALAQTYPFIEVVVADDGSTDDTVIKLQKYLSDPRFRYVKNETNKGRVNNYKELLYRHATGEWYINIDGDDYLKDEKFIARAIEAIEAKNTVVAVIADCEVYNEQTGTSINYTSSYNDGQVMKGIQFLQDVIQQKAQTTHASTLYNRAKAMQLGFYRLNILSSDFESIYRLVLQGDVVYIKTIAAVWRIHQTNVGITKTTKAALENVAYPQSVAAYAATQNINLAGWKNKMQQNLLATLLIESKQKSKIELIKVLLKCLRQYPLPTVKTLLNIKAILKHS